MSDYIIEAKDIRKTYNSGSVTTDAIKGINLYVERGEIVSVMGPSGCGKTTLLNCLSGLDEIDEGEVLIDGVRLHDLPDNDRSEYRAKQMGFVFQLYNLLPVLNAVENIELPLLLSGTSASESRRKSMDILDLVGLTSWACLLYTSDAADE